MRTFLPLIAGFLLLFAGCAKKEEAPASGKADTTTTAGAHPRLFFGAASVEALQKKTEGPDFKRDWEAIYKGAESALAGPAIAAKRDAAAIASAAGAAGRCAFVWRITGETRFRDRAKEIVAAVLASDGWAGDYLGKKGAPPRFHLYTAAICEGLALAYDLLAPEMTPAERKRFADVCRKKALDAFLEDGADKESLYLSGTRTMNWLAVIASGAGQLFLAIDKDAGDFSREIEIARAHALRFVEWYDDDGSAVEHGGYWTYGMGETLRFFVALKRNGFPDIMHQRSRKLERTAYPAMYGGIGGTNVANFCDDSYGPLDGARDPALILAAEFRDPVLQWWAGQLPPAGEVGFVSGDPALKAVAPDNLPTCMVFPRAGFGVMRSSMTDPDALYLAIKAGRARGNLYDDPHCQFDLNSIVLEAFGTILIADPGYGHDWSGPISVTDPNHPTNSTPPHNTALVDGRGQSTRFSPLAFLDDLSPAKDMDYIVSRIEQGYGPKVARFDRHCWFVDKRFFVLFDDIELTEPGKITWNFHGAKGSKIDAGGAIANGAARLRIIPVTPDNRVLAASVRDDHVLPRLQWDCGETRCARVAWLLIPERAGAASVAVRVDVQEDAVIVTESGRRWSLPIVRRRTPLNSSMTIIERPRP